MSIVADFHNQKSFPGYDNITARTLTPIENHDPKAGVARVTELLSEETKKAIEAKHSTPDQFIRRAETAASEARYIVNPENAQNYKNIESANKKGLKAMLENLVNTAKNHKGITTTVVILLAGLGTLAGVKAAQDKKEA